MIYLFVYLLFVYIFARKGKRKAHFELYMYILAICKEFEAVSCIFIFTPTVYKIEHYYLLTCTDIYSCSIYYYIYERNNCSIVCIFPEVKVINKTLEIY